MTTTDMVVYFVPNKDCDKIIFHEYVFIDKNEDSSLKEGFVNVLPLHGKKKQVPEKLLAEINSETVAEFKKFGVIILEACYFDNNEEKISA